MYSKHAYNEFMVSTQSVFACNIVKCVPFSFESMHRGGGRLRCRSNDGVQDESA